MDNELKEFNIEEFNIGQNLYIEASAGTGKTYTIQQLTAKMVGEAIPLEKILIVTYTDKATGELRDRIRHKLEECVACESDQRYRIALQNIHNAPIFTIHSFCKNTLDRFAYASNSAMNMSIIDDGEVSNLIDMLIRDVWANRDDFLDIISDTDFSFEHFKRNCIQAVLQYNRVDNVELDITDSELNNTDDLCRNNELFNKHLNRLKNIKEPSIVNDSVFSQTLSKIENWKKPEEFFYGWADSKKKKLLLLCENLPDKDEIIKAINFFFSLKGKLPEFFEQNREELFILENLEDIVMRWEQYKKDNKFQSYDNMIKTVHCEVCLKENSALSKKLRETYRYAIIDEFQDTNQRQWDIFKTLFLYNTIENNIIVIGDPKQSIYAFQGADLKVYRDAVKEIGVENGRRLSVNNRSSDLLITACNKIFSRDFFEDEGCFSESECPPVQRKKQPATLKGKVTQPLWISEKLELAEFCEYAVEKILECCKKGSDGKTALQIFDKKLKDMRNVSFSDFAVLGRTRSELVHIEEVMRSVGIPYTRYKDTDLFSGIEAFNWIALLKAINAPDFSGYNRKYLNRVLVTDFFRLDYSEVAKDVYSDPTKTPMKEILYWKILASKKRWSELQENIYIDTEIDKYLNVPSKLQSLAKLRQIGSYIFAYLYEHNASLDSAIKHLEGLAMNSEVADKSDGNLIAKGCDFQTVKTMTSHASKGLAFPIVIAIGGLKGVWSSMPGPFLYRDENRKKISFSDYARKRKLEEDAEEYRRLIYVAYTRAESLMLLPRYSYERKPGGFDFLISALKRMTESEYDNKENIVRVEKYDASTWDIENFKKEFKKVLEDLRETKGDIDKSSVDVNRQIFELQSNLNNLRIWKYSYSSINLKKKAIENFWGIDSSDENATPSEGRFNKDEGVVKPESDEETIKINSIEIDSKEDIIHACENYKSSVIENAGVYPKGSKLGNAIHSIFEKIDFIKFGNIASENLALKNTFINDIIEEAFEVQSLDVKGNPEWISITARMIWNTLNAELPVIRGNSAKKASFCLKDLSDECRKSEVEFHLGINREDWMNRFCKGYIDLLFVRKDEAGNDYFSILDWKSDLLEDSDYYDKEKLSAKVEKEYAVQRVLYSFCLITWLKMFYPESTDEEIFQKHFGGIYYAFVRGCKAGCCNGIYAQTWKSFKALQNSYNNVIKLIEA